MLLPLLFALLALFPVASYAGTAQTITFPATFPVTWDYSVGANSGPIDFSTRPDFMPTSSSGLPVTLSVLSGNATFTGTTLTFAGGGQVVIGATQAGDATYDPAPVAWKVLQVTPQFSAGGTHVLALKSDHTVWAWGSTKGGALGQSPAAADSFFPVQSAISNNVISVSATNARSFAVTDDGSVWAWGMNKAGELGDGSVTDRPIPTRVVGASTGFLSNIVAVAGSIGDWWGTSASSFALALKGDGTVWAWGANSYGTLGNNTTNSSLTPVQVQGLSNIIAISAGLTHGVALKADGTVWAWGNGLYGKLADLTTTTRLTPVQMRDTTDPSGYMQGVKAVVAGDVNTTILKKDGTVWSVGQNGYGQLGNGTVIDSVVTANSWVKAAGLTDVTAIASGTYQNVALKSDGTIAAWGWNATGQCGNGDPYTDIHTPYQVPGIQGVLSISAGIPLYANAPSSGNTMVLKNDGTIWGWGVNSLGQLGTGTTTNTLTPVQVTNASFSLTFTAGVGGTVNPGTTSTVQTFKYPFNTGIQDYSATTVAAPVTAVANTNSYWLNWTGPNGFLTTNPVITITSPTVTANYTANFVSKTVQVISLAPPSPLNYGNADLDLALYTSAGLSGNPVIYNIVSGPGTLMPDGHTLRITGVGSIVINANQAGNATFNAATTATTTIIINKAPANVFLSNLSQPYDSTQRKVTVTTDPAGLLVNLTYNGSTMIPVNAGSYTVTGNIADNNYTGGVTSTLVVTKGTPVLSWTTPADISLGTPLSATQLNATADVSGVFSYSKAAGTVLPLGLTTITATFSPTDSTNYNGAQTVEVIVNVVDTTAPVISGFAIPGSNTSLTVPITNFTASDNVAVTGYLLSEFPATPNINDALWTATKPGSYTFGTTGFKTLYAFTKDAAGNISIPSSATTTITMADNIKPTVDAFIVPATSNSLTVPISTLTINDNIGTIAWIVTESATAPLASDPNWLGAVPTQYVFNTPGAKTLYAWGRDAAGNISAPGVQNVTVKLPDIIAPLITNFVMPTAANSLTVPVSALTASDNILVTGYLINETGILPSLSDPAWSATAQTEHIFTSQGFKIVYAFAKDAAGNISIPVAQNVNIILPDTIPPVVNTFTVPATSTSLTVAISENITDNVGVTGYLITETATAPSPADPNWSSTIVNAWTFASAGNKTLYAWGKDAAGNISASKSANIVVTVPDITPPVVNSFVLPPTATILTVPVALSISDNVGVAAYWLSESPIAPTAGDPLWLLSNPTSYTFSSQGFKTLYAFGKDTSGNVSEALTARTTITLPDTTAPVANSFVLPTPYTSLIVPFTTLDITDDSGIVAAWLVSESATVPAANDPNWRAAKPAYYSFATQGSKTLYAWGKDLSGNISTVISATTVINLADNSAPIVEAFAIPASSTTLTVPITTLTIWDDVGVVGYLLTESLAWPSANDPAWSSNVPATYTFGSIGIKTLYAFGKDQAGNISVPLSARTSITTADITPPVVDIFTLPTTHNSLTVPVSAINATDNVGVTGYFLSQSATAPLATDSGWSITKPQQYTFTAEGAQTLYAYAKDAAGNVSAATAATVTINTTDVTPPVVNAFVLPTVSASYSVTLLSLVINDNVGVTGYYLSETATAPPAGSPLWSATKPVDYTFKSEGPKTLYAFGIDAAGNISAPVSAATTVKLPLPSITTLTVTPMAATGSIMLYNGAPFLIGTTVNQGDTLVVAVSSKPGYGILTVTGCSGTFDGTNYTTGAITESCNITPLPIPRNANSGTGPNPTVSDALRALMAYTGTVQLTAEQKIRYDVAPLDANSVPKGNGAVDLADVILTLRRIVGIGNW